MATEIKYSQMCGLAYSWNRCIDHLTILALFHILLYKLNYINAHINKDLQIYIKTFLFMKLSYPMLKQSAKYNFFLLSMSDFPPHSLNWLLKLDVYYFTHLPSLLKLIKSLER